MTSIRKYTPDDAPQVIALLVAAFLDDPGYRHVFPEHREDALRFVLPRLLALRLQSGTVRVAEREGKPVGVLCSNPSNTRFTLFDYLRQGLLRMPFAFGWETTRHLLAVDSELVQLKNTVAPPVHHRHLAQLACHPDAQGTGVGTALVRAFLEEEVDPAGQPAVLLTARAANVLWYEKFGFAIAGQNSIDQAFTAWCMVRGA